MGPASPGGTPTGGRAPHQGMVGSEPRPSTRSRQPGQRCPWGGPQGPCPEHCGRQHPAAHPQVGLSLRQTPASAHRLLAVRLSRGPSAPSPQRVRSSILLTTRGPPCSRGLSWEPVKKGRLWVPPQKIAAWDPGVCIKEMPHSGTCCREPFAHPGDRPPWPPNSLQPYHRSLSWIHPYPWPSSGSTQLRPPVPTAHVHLSASQRPTGSTVIPRS